MEVPVEHISPLADQVMGLMLLILVASMTELLSHRLPRLPYTVALVLVGALLHELSGWIPGLHLLTDFELTPELVLFVFLPTLIFESAHNLDARELQSNLLPVLTLAVPGLLLSTAIIGGIIYSVSSFELIICLLLGSILSATDPVAVISLFKQLGVPERLTVLVEGESLFNDATSLVLATLLLGIAVSGEFASDTVYEGIGRFLVVFLGGIAIGSLFAFVATQLLGRIHAVPVVEISLTTVLAYLSFLVAEHSLHVSGIMAVVAAGLIMGSYGSSKISPGTVEYMEHFWDYAAALANALIFLLVGMQVDMVGLWQNIDLILWVAIAMLISRAVVVFGLVPQLARLPNSEPVSKAYQLVMYWGGLRGAIALAIVLSLPAFDYKDTLVAVVMGAVLFTLLVQGLSIENLVNRLGLSEPDMAEKLAQKEAGLHAKEHSLASLEGLEKGGFFSSRVADRLRQESVHSIHQLQEDISRLSEAMHASDSGRILSMRTLSREKSRYQELFRRGLVGEPAFRELAYNVRVQLDDAKHYGKLPGATYGVSPLEKVLVWVVQSLGMLPLLGGWSEHHQRMLMMRDYQVSWARYRAASSVLRNLDEIAAESGVSAESVQSIRDCYQTLAGESQAELEQTAELYPEFVEASQEKLGSRLLLISEQDAIGRVGALGILPDGVATAIMQDQEKRLRSLASEDLTRFLEINPTELLAKVPMFSGLDEESFLTLARHLRMRSFPKGESIIQQHQHGNSLFMIARGVASVTMEIQASEEVARLYAGDVFGEAALLHGSPRNATVTAVTPCTAYELHREEWLAVCSAKPDILSAVEAVDMERSQ